MTGAWAAASRSMRAVRATTPIRARGGGNFDSGREKLSLGATAPYPVPDITSPTPVTSGPPPFVQNVPPRPCPRHGALPAYRSHPGRELIGCEFPKADVDLLALRSHRLDVTITMTLHFLY